MNILCVNGRFCSELAAMGHTVRNVPLLEPGLYRLASLPEAQDKTALPDLLIQEEYLGVPVILEDLDNWNCPKAFWSIDSHLNLYWQHFYARLFDVVLTPHVSWFEHLPQEWRHPHVKRFAWPCSDRSWKAHPERTHDMVFVGRLTSSRPLRGRLTRFLAQTYSAPVLDSLPRSAMFDLYDDTRLLPNECIAFETNFRLLEGASCGCCVLTPDSVGDDQSALLEPGKEILTYHDILELRDLLNFCLRKPRMAEAVGQAARQRVQAGHLPRHRARELERLAACSPAALRGNAAQEALCQTLLQLWSNGRRLLSRQALEQRLARLAPTPAAKAAALLFAAENGEKETLATALREIIMSPFLASRELADTAIAAAVLLEDAELACALKDNYCRMNGLPAEPARSLFQFCLAEAPRVAATGRQCRPGVQLTPEKCPLTALELLFRASAFEPDNLAWVREILNLCDVRAHLLTVTLGCHARLALEPSCSWRERLAYALENFRCYRMEEGTEELMLTLLAAEQAGEKAFLLQTLQHFSNAHILHHMHTGMAQAAPGFLAESYIHA